MKMFDKEKLRDLKETLKHDDRPIFLENVLECPEDWANWKDIEYCCENPSIFDVRYFNKVESKYDGVTVVKLMTNSENEAHAIERRGNLTRKNKRLNPVKVTDAKKLLNKNHSIIITNFEYKNQNCKNMIDFLCHLFYYNVENHGVWPAKIGPNSGHAHCYAGKKESNSFSPHVDGPANFIFQIEGQQKFTVYENKKCALTEIAMPADAPLEYRKEVYDNLRVYEERIMNPGDMVYVPSRTYHYVEPVTDRISMSFPLILKGPTSVML